MKIAPVSHGLELGRNAPGYERSGGLHMSDIYNSLYEALYPKRYTQGELPLAKLEAGMVFEEMLEEGFKVRLASTGRPGEFMTPEGVAYSPDLLIFNGDTTLGEIKLTWYSCRYAPVSREQAEAAGQPHLANDRDEFDSERFDKWFTQIKAYCYHLKLHKARLIVCFVNGNYKPPTPVVLAWDLQFSQRELDENWAMLLNHARSEGML